MTGRPGLGKARARGNIEELRSGALRVRVYAGIDPVTKKRHNLIEVVPPGPKAWREAEKIRDRLLHEVAEKRNPRTSATVDQLLTRYLDQFDGAPNTLTLYRRYVRKHVAPFLGPLKVGEVDADLLDSLYAELRRCRDHCSGRHAVQHHASGPHECDKRCRPHICRPLGPTTVRHVHFLLSGAFGRAVRWRWVAINPVGQATPPPAPKPNPQPPTSSEAARIVTEAWRDPDWGALVWTTMTTGARRGEICAIRRSSLNLDEGRETVWLRKAIRNEHGKLVEAELKTHQQRRVALDPETVTVLREHLARCDARARALGFELPADAFVFSATPDGSTFLRPDGVTQRYERLARRLGIDTTFHKLRHYSATELIAGGVDPRTVAGRLGHGGGGTTTLKTYTAWVSEADQRAARGLGAGMPQRPVELEKAERARTAPRYPYEVVAVALAGQVTAGTLPIGSFLPPSADIAVAHGVSVSTAKRALLLARDWGLVERVGRNRLRVVDAISTAAPSSERATTEPGGEVLLDLVIRHRGTVVARFSSVVDHRSATELHQVLVDAVGRLGGDVRRLPEYEMDLRTAGKDELITTFVASRRRPS
jgi:integrase